MKLLPTQELISDAKTIFENENIIIFDKPHRVHSHAQAHSLNHTMVGHYLKLYPEAVTEWANLLELGLLHRLDYETSGLLVFAKNKTTYDEIKSIWKTPRVKKYYTAIVTSKGELTEGLLIQDEIAHAIHHRSKMVSSKNKKFKRGQWQEAKTKIHSIQTHPLGYKIEIEIFTGITHQIRCHLASYEAPIMGDPLYSKSSYQRMCLNASKLVLELGTTLNIESEVIF